jgi:hypothetical protein
MDGQTLELSVPIDVRKEQEPNLHFLITDSNMMNVLDFRGRLQENY